MKILLKTKQKNAKSFAKLNIVSFFLKKNYQAYPSVKKVKKQFLQILFLKYKKMTNEIWTHRENNIRLHPIKLNR